MTIFSNKLFKNPIKIIQAFSSKELKQAFNTIEELKNKYFLVGYIRYKAFDTEKSTSPILYFEVFDKYKEFTPNPINIQNLTLKPCVNYNQYSNAIKKIKHEISQGNTYEVNYTYDFDVDYKGDDFELFQFLLQKQKTQYCYYTKNQYDTVLSFSPELFFTLKNNHIITKPMKGTIKRSDNPLEDKKLINFLKTDKKNQAENVMIVDLLRNDLGKISIPGTIKVTKLFEIETHKTLHQMTSQIESDLLNNITLYEIFKSIFPCGSITGAPKISTMKIIDEVEIGSREIYCGAIGFLSPKEIVFSVPIRILQKINNFNFKYRVGGAIVWDSDIQNEWEETLTKTKFLCENFQIIETIKVENNKLLFADEHFKRMEQSAKFFGFKFHKPEISSKKDGILRILLNKNGEISTTLTQLTQNNSRKISISPIKVNSKNIFLYHKTTYRPWFYDSYQKISSGEIFDEIFFNEKDELTEGSRSNIVLKINGKLFTPPINCGILNGIFRQQLKGVNEKVLYKSDLLKAEKIYCINSVRGMVEVHL